MVINPSDQQLTREEGAVLKRGFDFALAPRKLAKEKIISEIEMAKI